MAAKTRIWTCPRCDRAAVRAPERMRRDDARRYCLPCTADTGRLLERHCPSLDRERAERAGRQEAKRERQAERERQAQTERRCVEGVDMERELKRLSRLPIFGGRSGTLASRPPELRMRRVSRAQGTAVRWSSNSLVLSVWPGRSAEDVAAWLLWGLAAIHRRRTSSRNGSTRSLKVMVADAGDEAWLGLGTLHGATDTEVVQSLISELTATGALRRTTSKQ